MCLCVSAPSLCASHAPTACLRACGVPVCPCVRDSVSVWRDGKLETRGVGGGEGRRGVVCQDKEPHDRDDDSITNELCSHESYPRFLAPLV